MYLTYDEYVNMGGVSDAAVFKDYENLEFEASAVIDWYTFNRLQKESVYPEAVKRCMYKLIALIQEQRQAMIVNPKSSDGTIRGSVASESNDGVSASYNVLSAKDAVESIQSSLQTTVNMYLQGVKDSLGHKLLYRGVYADE